MNVLMAYFHGDFKSERQDFTTQRMLIDVENNYLSEASKYYVDAVKVYPGHFICKLTGHPQALFHTRE